MDTASFQRLLGDALRRRVGPERAIGFKHFAGDMHVTEQTVWNWINATREPLSHHVVSMLNYFDASFAREIGIEAEVVKLSDARYQQAKRLNEAMEAWRASA